ncbi:hypothetical protein [Sinorhizobium medicae]|nr:hypothetical protein [Sinorhizobium medicae]
MTYVQYLIACATVAGIPLAIMASYKAGRYIASRHPMPEPKIDMDLLEAELSMEAALIEDRLANDRRLYMASRAQ